LTIEIVRAAECRSAARNFVPLTALKERLAQIPNKPAQLVVEPQRASEVSTGSRKTARRNGSVAKAVQHSICPLVGGAEFLLRIAREFGGTMEWLLHGED